MIPLKAWNIIQPKKAQQHANRNISMSSCVRQYSTALSHNLLMLTPIIWGYDLKSNNVILPEYINNVFDAVSVYI